MSCEEQLRIWGSSGLEKRRLRSDRIALCSFLRGQAEREVLVSSPWYPVIGHVQMVQGCIRGDLDWTLGSVSLPRGWSNTGTGFLEGWSMPQACQCLRGIWTMPLITCFNFWSALNYLGSWTRWSLYIPSNWNYSIPFHSIPFHSIPLRFWGWEDMRKAPSVLSFVSYFFLEHPLLSTRTYRVQGKTNHWFHLKLTFIS